MPSVWEKPSGYLLSTNEKSFIIQALKKELRIDGRRPYDFRKLQIQISLDGTSATVRLGQTLVEATVSATIEQPNTERPNEGMLRLRVDSSPMAAPGLDSAGRTFDDAAELQRMLEKAVRDLRAVDLEALCIAAGRKVWRVSVDAKVLDAAGNIADAVFLAALAGLTAFRRPDASFETLDSGRTVVVLHPIEEREAIPLSLHQAPLAVTFALFQEGDAAVVDPHMKEEAAADGSISVVLNAQDEVCLLHKAGGLGLSLAEILRLVRIAALKRAELSESLKAALEAHEAARVAARVRRKVPAAAQAARSRTVAVLPAVDLAGIEEELGIDMKSLEEAIAAPSSSSEDEEAVQMDGTEQVDASHASSPPERYQGPAEHKPSRRHGEAATLPAARQRGTGETAAPSNPPYAEGNNGAVVRQSKSPSGKQSVSRTEMDTDEFEHIAALIAGPKTKGGDLRAAVKQKRRGGA